MQKTERFERRKKEFELAFHPRIMKKLWRDHVRSMLRNSPIQDLHDYYDYHLQIEGRIDALRDSILKGTYQPSLPIRFRSEKKHGLSRHLVLLVPGDALIFEALGDYIAKPIHDKQPSDRAYYSRNRRMPMTPSDVDASFGYPWWIAWPKYQKKILDFSQRRKYTVTTDVANYYDGIDFIQLRNFLSGLSSFSETLLDLLFYLIERFAWRPDYLPFQGRGLPQIELDVPRLLAHTFLFEIDELLLKRTEGDFVRWLDDIVFGCDSIDEAQDILRSIDELLLSRGLHLNLGKTQILDARSAYEHFQIKENVLLTVISNILDVDLSKHVVGSSKLTSLNKLFRIRLSRFFKAQTKGYWTKIYKRYYNTAARIKDPILVEYASEHIERFPELRETIFRYFAAIGWARPREEMLTGFVTTTLDDANAMRAIDVLLRWVSGSNHHEYSNRMQLLANTIAKKKTIFGFVGALWLLGKYGTSTDIKHLVFNYIDIWKTDGWLARQVVALWPRLDEETRKRVMNIVYQYGHSNALLVIDNYKYIQSDKRILREMVLPYILATKSDGTYTLPKLLIVLTVLQSSEPGVEVSNIAQQVLAVVRDPIYRQLVQREVLT